MWTFTSDYFYIENDDRKGRRSADQSATKVVDNSSEAEDDDIDSKHGDGGGGWSHFKISLEWLHIA